MAARGDVLIVRRRIGFGASREVERFAVLQSDAFNAAVETLVVAPLDTRHAFYAGFPAAVPVPREEAGTASPQVLLVSHLAAVAAARFEPVAVARLGV